MISRILWAVGIAFGAFLALTFFGVETLFAVAWSLLAGVTVFVAAVIVPEDPRADAPDTTLPERRVGSEVSRLAWAINPRTGEAGQLVLRRAAAVLRRRLRTHGIDVDDPAERERVDQRLGAGVWDALRRPRATRADIERALDAARRLQDPHTIEETPS